MKLLKVVTSQCETPGDIPFYIIALQGLAFFNEHVLLFARGGNTGDELALMPGVRRQP